MIDKVLSILAPHHCLGCDESGPILCQCCENHITDEPFSGCLICSLAIQADSPCAAHQVAYQKAWCVTRREGVTKELVDAFKFQRAIEAYRQLADLFDSRLPDLPANTIVVPIPTAPSNVRIRGYDHMLLVAKELSKRRGLNVVQTLERKSNITQHFAKSAAERRSQAAGFFKPHSPIHPSAPYLIIDDIFTTGSTVGAAADCLKGAGASDIWVAVISKQIQS